MAERSIISTASRSSCPVLRRPRNRICNHWSTSRAISSWTAAAVFFLGSPRAAVGFERPMLANLLIDRDQFLVQSLQPMVLVNFGLCLAPSRRRGERFGHGFSVHFPGEPNLRIMSPIFGLGTMAGRLSAAASHRADRTLAQVAEGAELTKNLGTLGFQLR